MARRFTTEEFIERAKLKHGDKYDYSKVEYFNNHTNIMIICPIHGEFQQRPEHHLNGSECPKCARKKGGILRSCPNINKRRLIYGVGINDVFENITFKYNKAYHIWRQMLFRCYDSKCQHKRPTYIGCSVCKEWHKFSNFKKWFDENYVDGWCLDKDILVKGNREYSPDKCCFVPNEINTLFNRHKGHRSKTGVMGVQFFRGKYVVYISKYGINRLRGTFENVVDAMNFYKRERELYIKEVAEKWKDKLKDNVYQAVMSYEVKIND